MRQMKVPYSKTAINDFFFELDKPEQFDIKKIYKLVEKDVEKRMTPKQRQMMKTTKEIAQAMGRLPFDTLTKTSTNFKRKQSQM